MSTRDNRGSAPLVILVVILAVAALGFAGIAYWQSMNGTKEAAALKDQLEAEQGAKEELEGKMADLESEKALKEKETEEAKKLAEEKAKEAEVARSALLTVPETWASSTIRSVGLKFRFPREWGAVKTSDVDGESGEGVRVSFTKSQVVMASYSKDFSLGTMFPEEHFAPKTAPGSCEGLKAHVSESVSGYKPFEKIVGCEMFDRAGRKVFVFRFPASEENEVSLGERDSAIVYTGSPEYPTVYMYAMRNLSIGIDILRRVAYSFE